MSGFKKFILSIVLFPAISCYANNPVFSTLSVENGLSGTHVKAIYQDSDGYMWFGTIEGLDRWDGYEIRPFIGNFPSGPQNINCLFEDTKKNLWIGTERGIYLKKYGGSAIIAVIPDSLKVRVTCILEANSGEIAFGTDQGVLLLEPMTLVNRRILFSEDPADPVNRLTGMLKDFNGNIWIATQGGLIRMQKNSDVFEIIRNISTGQGNMFSAITLSNDKIFLGTRSSGLVNFNISDGSFSKVSGLDNKIILCLASGDNNIYIGTDGGGLNILDLKTSNVSFLLHDPSNPATIGSNSVYSFLSGSNGHIWIGTFSAGVSHGRSQNLQFSVYTPQKNNILLNKSIRSFYFPDSRSKLLGSREGFYFISEGEGSDNVQFYKTDPDNKGLRTNIILSIYNYENKILVGTYGGGVIEFNPNNKRFKNFLNEPYFLNGFVYYFEKDKSGDLWIATLNGLYCYHHENHVLDHFTTLNSSLTGNEVFSLLFDSEERLWVGMINGLNLFSTDGPGLTPIDSFDYKQVNFKINYLYEDSGKNVWICTETGGLFRFDKKTGKFDRFTEEEGLSGNSVCAIIESSPGVYWISTLRGLCKMTVSSIEKYSVSDGLPGLAFTPAAVYKEDDGNLWFGNELGLVYFYPDSIKKIPQNVPVQITDFLLSGKILEPDPLGYLKQPLETTEEIVLPGKQNSIGFRFAALNYIDAADNRYEYKLEGENENWQSSGNSNQAIFENLKPGKYVFCVKPEGEPEGSESVKKIRIIIKSQLLSHPIFITVVSILALLGSVLLYSRFRKQSEVINRFKEENKPHEKYERSRLNDALCEEIILKLKEYMEKDKPYLDGNLKLADVANKIGCPAYALSQVLNLKMNQSFTDYINNYRIEEVKKRMVDLDMSKYKLLTIAKDCGFNSKTSFHRIFKNLTGFTPAEYISSVKKS
jgi:ligand-binding sensor domain-containing protein/AraC-like DNA-binding protein